MANSDDSGILLVPKSYAHVPLSTTDDHQSNNYNGINNKSFWKVANVNWKYYGILLFTVILLIFIVIFSYYEFHVKSLESMRTSEFIYHKDSDCSPLSAIQIPIEEIVNPSNCHLEKASASTACRGTGGQFQDMDKNAEISCGGPYGRYQFSGTSLVKSQLVNPSLYSRSLDKPDVDCILSGKVGIYRSFDLSGGYSSKVDVACHKESFTLYTESTNKCTENCACGCGVVDKPGVVISDNQKQVIGESCEYYYLYDCGGLEITTSVSCPNPFGEWTVFMIGIGIIVVSSIHVMHLCVNLSESKKGQHNYII
mmetsp:Transcript_12414/g.11249  ORF Transcript_12414/g.11249 Transcript_12414/m.11249 type:complete len:311 (+) Transcript_12414:84-1016(+)